MQNGAASAEGSLVCPKIDLNRPKIELPLDPANPSPGVYLKDLGTETQTNAWYERSQ